MEGPPDPASSMSGIWRIKAAFFASLYLSCKCERCPDVVKRSVPLQAADADTVAKGEASVTDQLQNKIVLSRNDFRAEMRLQKSG